MYFKIKKGSQLYEQLFKILDKEFIRESQFESWMKDNLPEFNGNCLVEHNPWYMYATVFAWKFTDEVDKNIWIPLKGYEGYFVPNKRTKAGKAMYASIIDAMGMRFHRMDFFDIFQTTIPVNRREFTVPNGLMYNGDIFMFFDDGNYKDISTKFKEQIIEMTASEFLEVMSAKKNHGKGC